MSESRVHRLSVVSERVERTLVRIVRIVGVTLALTILVVPLVRIVPDDSDDPTEALTLGALISTISEPTDRILDGDHGRSEHAGLIITRVSVVVIIIGGIATVVSALAFTTSNRRRDVVILRISGGTLLCGALLLWTGAHWLPVGRNDEIGPAWGIAVPILAAVVGTVHPRPGRRRLLKHSQRPVPPDTARVQVSWSNVTAENASVSPSFGRSVGRRLRHWPAPWCAGSVGRHGYRRE